jgi:hypothetical protein
MALGRMYARTQDRDQVTTWATREAQYDAVCAWGIPDHGLLQRLSGIELPVFVANGDRQRLVGGHVPTWRGQRLSQFPAGGNAKFGEHFAEVPFHGAGAEE